VKVVEWNLKGHREIHEQDAKFKRKRDVDQLLERELLIDGWISGKKRKKTPLGNGDIQVLTSQIVIPFTDNNEKGAFFVVPKDDKDDVKIIDKGTFLGWYAGDCTVEKEDAKKDSEYIIQLEIGCIDGVGSLCPSVCINHKWTNPVKKDKKNAEFTNVVITPDGKICTSSQITAFKGHPVELFFDYGDCYWYHRISNRHPEYEPKLDFDELSKELQTKFKAFHRIVLPNNVELLSPEEQFEYTTYWTST
jgi:hypothetical protein